MNGLIITGAIAAGAALGSWAWWRWIGRGMARRQEERSRLELVLSPLYRAKLEEDRRYHLARVALSMKYDRLMIGSRRVSEQNTEPLQITGGLPPPFDLSRELAAFTPSPGGIFLGRAASGPVLVPMSRLWHIALAGATGGGKTNILRLILAQLLHLGAVCYLCDIHYAPVKRGVDWTPIAGRLAAPPVRDVATIAELVKWMARQELQARIDREFRGEAIGAPMYLAIEELPALVGERKDVIPDLAKLLRQGRQYDLCVIGAAQDILVSTLGTGGGVRECFRTGFYTGGDMTTARVLLDLQKGQSINEAGLGEAGRVYLKTVLSTMQEVRVPWADNEAVRWLLSGSGALGTSHTSRTNNVSGSNWLPEQDEADDSAVPGTFLSGDTPACETPAIAVSEEERRQIIALAQAKTPRRKIRRMLGWGGNKYPLIKAVLDEGKNP